MFTNAHRLVSTYNSFIQSQVTLTTLNRYCNSVLCKFTTEVTRLLEAVSTTFLLIVSSSLMVYTKNSLNEF